MNREILFRGKRIDNGEWVYGYVIKNEDGTTYIAGNSYLYCEVIPRAIGKCC